MILKIDMNKNKKDTLEYGEYWIFGEIERIHYKYWASGGTHSGFDLELFCLIPDGEKDVNEDVLQIYLRFEDTKRDIYNILLQGCTCYLCNNDGKTIDKLVC